ncbi:hypothetical protein D3C80_1739800 [compost metagenome]
MRPVRERLGAVRIVGQGVVGDIGSWRQLHHVLRTQVPDDRVVAAVGAEQDPVRRLQGGDVDDVVAGIAIDGDRVNRKAGRREVADHQHGIVARTGI